MEHTLNLALLAEHEREKLESYQQEIEHWQKKKQELSRRKQEENNKVIMCDGTTVSFKQGVVICFRVKLSPLIHPC